MKTILFSILFCLSITDGSAQFFKKIDAEFSYGFMRSFNKNEIISDTINIGFSNTRTDIQKERYLNTRRYSFEVAYHFTNKHAVSLGYSFGKVGSRLTGSIRTFDDISSSFISFEDLQNIATYRSFNLNYSFTFPFDGNELITTVGVQRQSNDLKETFLIVGGTFGVNYNASLSVGFSQELFQSIYLVPKVTMINSFKRKNILLFPSRSSFVPFQIGFELGLRLGFDVFQ